MVLHLESGNCESGTELHDINTWVFDDFGCRQYTNQWTDYYQFCCPTCSNTFRYISGLMQHIESNACDQNAKMTTHQFKSLIDQKI